MRTTPAVLAGAALLLAVTACVSPTASADTGLTVWTVPSFRKVDRLAFPGPTSEARIWAARGEQESFQVVVRAGYMPLEGVDVHVSDLRGETGTLIPASRLTLYRQHYVQVDRTPAQWGPSNRPGGPGWYPDALIPFRHPATGADITGAALDASPFRVEANQNQPIWVDVAVPRDAAPGLYRGYYTVTTAHESFEGQIFLTVWNFTLPERPSLESSFSFWTQVTARDHQELLRHRLAPLTVRATDQRELIDAHGLGTTNFGFWSGADAATCNWKPAPTLAQVMATKATHQSDIRLYNYTADEVDGCPQAIEALRSWGRALHQAQVRQLVTIKPVRELFDDGTGRPAVDIWVLLPKFFDEARETIAEARQRGSSLWTYNALVQDSYSPKWLIAYDWVNYRIQPGMLNFVHHSSGLLYWRVDLWQGNPWLDVNNSGRITSANLPGEGMLLYPGAYVGADRAVPSIRLKALRDGADDFDYLTLLTQLGKRDWAENEVRTVAESWRAWSKDGEAVELVRRKLGDELAALTPHLGNAPPP